MYCSCDIAANSLIHSSSTMAHNANSFVRMLCSDTGCDVKLKLSSEDSLKSLSAVLSVAAVGASRIWILSVPVDMSTFGYIRIIHLSNWLYEHEEKKKPLNRENKIAIYS